VGPKSPPWESAIEAATGVTSHSNVRGGFNMFSYSRDFSRDGINYGGELKLRSIEVHYDWFIFHGTPCQSGSAGQTTGIALRQAPVCRAANHSRSAAIPTQAIPRIPSQDRLGSTSAKTRCLPCDARVGNLLRRSGRRFSISFEGGVVFQSSPQATLNLGGSACFTGVCQNIASHPQLQNDVAAEQNKINEGLPPYDTIHTVLKYYPVVSIGFGYRFK
jgi:hypothetical protein